MIFVKFDHSVKYNGVRYSAHEVFSVNNDDVPELRKVGAIVMSEKTDENAEEKELENAEEGVVESKDVNKLKEHFLKYSVAELTKFAQDNDIDLQGKTKKADIYNIIVETLQ